MLVGQEVGLGWGGVRVSDDFVSDCSSSIGTSVTGLCRMDQFREWHGSVPHKPVNTYFNFSLILMYPLSYNTQRSIYYMKDNFKHLQ